MRYFLLGILLTVLSDICFGQDLVKGIVVDSATFGPLSSVSVQLKNKQRGTTTDNQGNFSIQGTELDTLVLTFVGYKRLELPLLGYEPSVIRLAEQPTILAPIIIHDSRLYQNPYEGLFNEQNARLKKKIPFYYHKSRKDKIKAANWREEAARVQTYVDVVINDPETKKGLIQKYNLTEKEYYELLTAFNEKHYNVMYYLTKGELISLLNKFFEANVPIR
ncbi:carboxypeptidase-like regulatory domain-containing protein [Chryseosolibacter indicus]|uniref:Carboxypeptidase-like regulatory domain-containing protein n=1 Tax=Chryseosolibacter indicus TaxID=2782351 RepID=A0ABS5VXS8_9BACT|nr:carboxypeptidase-like regulatory domain-containing protein [Chryseosolibacter indicus]MBT1706061.1 carboxypeptidase-like regulatory domain-containing protein [Chryseosolibacter indicus]